MLRPLMIGLGLTLAAMPAHAQQAAPASVTSPDGRIAVTLMADNDGRPTYTVMRDGKPVIEPSHIGFLLADADPLTRNFRMTGSETGAVDSRWEQPWGERRFVRDHHRSLKARFQETSALGRVIEVEFRVFDDGVGFRTHLPQQPNLATANIAEEATEFVIAEPGTAWWIQGGDWNRYEQIYAKTPIDAVSTAHTPITMKLDGGLHLAFHEAALVDYSGMWFQRVERRRFRTTLSPGTGGGPKVVRAAPFHTPWRTIRIAEDAPGLYDNDLELNLNEPNKLGDVSWVVPHKYIGIWWEMHLDKWSWATGPKHGATTEHARGHIDFAAKHGFRGVLIEGWNKGWDGPWFGGNSDFSFTQGTPDFDFKAVTDYARAKGVRLIGHHETGGNIADYEAQLDAAMKLYADAGVDSVKTGYVADAGGIQAPNPAGGRNLFGWHDGQRMAQHHLKVVETAAKYRIAVNAHEPIKDTGLRRTYPNWVAREGARGMEYNAWGSPVNPAGHEATLVFTRMLSGPMDFTPGVLSLKGKGDIVLNSTLAKQLALYVVLYSPIQMAADLPENLAKYPRELEFIKAVPADWAETRMLSGVVGEHAVLARKDRKSNDWYLGGVTDDTARAPQLTLDFLDAGRDYTATIWRDGEGADFRTDARHAIAYETKRVRKGETLTIPMAPGGGFAVRLAAAR
ncbi:glycoside hydrolase family 97 protein [Sphingomonas baiyangensis]|uniref:Glycoside hydrolase family 97 protein n=1 Tax=Sphingomonas baiyangensis TaxID=2572576 RepID=A0A4U1L6C2_9SPHN|nr:glycoside hydrolase family 97 protein [Sphingomonas baiyangensis]TKD51820.1 glycoside hydrolase family 97 protein [Sphingomonas baiyangensis]